MTKEDTPADHDPEQPVQPAAQGLSGHGEAEPELPGWTTPGATYPFANADYPSYGGQPGYTGYADAIASPAPSPRGRIAAIASAVVVVALLAVGGIVALASTSHHHSSANPAPAVTGSASGSAPPSAPSPSASASMPDGAPAAPGPLDSYLLAPTDLGAGTFMALISGGRDASGEPTLDFCNYPYTSETLRMQRVQVEYLGGSQRASNEFVHYQPGGATKAYAEIQKAVAGCPSTFREYGSVAGQIQRVSGLSGLAAEQLVVTYADTSTALTGATTTTWSTVVYQFDGDYFSGVYVYGTDKQAVQQFAASLGVKAAKHLAEAASGKPGTGGGPLVGPGQPDAGVQA